MMIFLTKSLYLFWLNALETRLNCRSSSSFVGLEHPCASYDFPLQRSNLLTSGFASRSSVIPYTIGCSIGHSKRKNKTVFTGPSSSRNWLNNWLPSKRSLRLCKVLSITWNQDAKRFKNSLQLSSKMTVWAKGKEKIIFSFQKSPPAQR